MHSATKHLALCALIALCGCGNYGNLTLEDSVYLNALPSSQDLKYDGPQGTGQPLCGALGSSKIATDTRTLAVQLSQSVVGFLGVIDFIKALPPSQRDSNSRTWGPWPDNDHPGVNVLVKMTKVSEEPRFTLEIQQQPRGGTFVTVVTGEFIGALAHKGHGALHFNYAASAAVGTNKLGDPIAGSLNIDYDFTSDPRTIHIATSGVPVSTDVGIASYLDGQARVDLKYTDTASGDQVAASSKFNAKGEGIANWSAKRGIYADSGKECWDMSYCRTYINDIAGWTQPPCTGAFCIKGLEASCPSGLH